MSSPSKHTGPLTVEHYFGVLAACLIMLSGIQAAAVFLSLVRVSITQPIAWAILLLSALLALGYLRVWRSLYHRAADDQPEPTSINRLAMFPLLGIPVAAYLFLWLAALTIPDNSYDGNVYHIPAMHYWALQGHLGWVDARVCASEFVNGYPKGSELLAYVMVRAFQDSRLVTCANLLFLPLGVLGITGIARMLGAPSVLALAGGMLFILVPVNLTQAVTSYVDSGYGSCAVAFLAMLSHAHYARHRSGRLRWQFVLPLGCAMGLAVAVKGSGLLLVGIGLPALLIAQGGLRADAPRRTIPFLAACLAIATVVGGYWYVRNYAMTGSPVYPMGVRVAGLTVFPGSSVSEILREGENTPAFMREWSAPRRIAFTWTEGLFTEPLAWPASVDCHDSRTGGLGLLWVMGCVPAVLAALWGLVRHRSGDTRERYLLMPVALVGLVFLTTPMNWWARYTVWVYALGLPSFALVAGRALGERRSWVAGAWVLACVLVAFLESGYILSGMRGDVIAFSHPDGRPGRTLRLVQWYTTDGNLLVGDTTLREVLQDRSPVAVGKLSEPLAPVMGKLSLPIGGRPIVLLRPDADAGDVMELRRRHVRYVIWDDAQPLPPALRESASGIRQTETGLWVLRLAEVMSDQ